MMVPLRTIALCAVMLGVTLLASPHATASPTPPAPSPIPAVGGLKHPALASQLVLLAHTAALVEIAGMTAGKDELAQASPSVLASEIAAGRILFDDRSRVSVYLETNGPFRLLLDQLDQQHIEVAYTDEEAGIAQAWVTPSALYRVAVLPSVQHIRLPDFPVSNTGVVTTEGDAVINADILRSSVPGLDGTGVTVGVIADGVAGLTESQASGDLPAVDTTTCNITGGDPAAVGSEGTALLEIIHDIAPAADLMFGNFGFLPGLPFNEAVNCLAEHADIVVDDIGFFGAGPYDGTSVISQNTTEALNGGGDIRAYVTAAGNQAVRHYQNTFVDSGFLVNFGGGIWSAHEFGTSSGEYPVEHAGLVSAPANLNRFRLNPGGEVLVTLVWDDGWDSSGNDYDLFFSDAAQIQQCSLTVQDGDDHPTESCLISNDGAEQRTIDILVANYQGAAQPRVLDMFVVCRGCAILGNGNYLDFTTRDSSIGNQADAGGSPASVITVGAVRFNNPTGIEAFSGRGPTEDGRFKPDVVGPDNVCVSGAVAFLAAAAVCQNDGRRFLGTSAAAPHVAGVAALLLDCAPGLSRTELHSTLVENSVDTGEAGPDNMYGHGLVDAVESAIAAGYCGQPTPTPSATPTASNTPTPTDTPTITPTPSDTPTPTDTPTSTPTATPSHTPTVTPTPSAAIGDVDCNGVVSSVDAALILQFSATLIPGLPCQSSADVNTDAAINSVDAALVLQFVANLINSLPP